MLRNDSRLKRPLKGHHLLLSLLSKFRNSSEELKGLFKSNYLLLSSPSMLRNDSKLKRFLKAPHLLTFPHYAQE